MYAGVAFILDPAFKRSFTVLVPAALCYSLQSVTVRAVVGMGIPMGIPTGMGRLWDGYGDCDESPWVCGNSVGIIEWI